MLVVNAKHNDESIQQYCGRGLWSNLTQKGSKKPSLATSSYRDRVRRRGWHTCPISWTVLLACFIFSSQGKLDATRISKLCCCQSRNPLAPPRQTSIVKQVIDEIQYSHPSFAGHRSRVCRLAQKIPGACSRIVFVQKVHWQNEN